MKVTFQAVHFTADQKLKQYISGKLESLQRFASDIVESTVYLKLENTGQVRDKVVEIKVNVPGKTLVARQTNKSFEVAVVDAIQRVKRQLCKNHDTGILYRKRNGWRINTGVSIAGK